RGAIQIALAGRTVRLNLSGQGTGASLVYEAAVGGTLTTLTPNGTLALPATNLGSSTPATIRGRNTGSSDGQIPSISLTAAGYQPTTVPALPATLSPGQALAFGIVFTPTQSGTAQGRLLIGTVVINLSGTGVGAPLTVPAVQAGVSTPLDNNGTLIFPNTAVG